MWASTALLLFAGEAAAGEARALSPDSMQIVVHAASNEAVDGWEAVAPEAMPAGTPDSLWISPDSVALDPARWERLTFRLENQRPATIITPGPQEQDALRTLLHDMPGRHVVVVVNGTIRRAAQVLSIEGTARSLTLTNLPPDEAAQMVQQWQTAHRRAPSPNSGERAKPR